MDYFSNSFQLVKDEDAANIAEALEKALDNIPDNPSGDFLPENPLPSEIEYFSGFGKETLRQLISYFRMGGFSIV